MHIPMKLIQAHGAGYGLAGSTQPAIAASRAARPAIHTRTRIDRALT
jgi:hypothetical protein